MSTLLRGKQLLKFDVKDNFTKTPNQIFALDLNSTDKLILIRLFYYPANWTLAYTRLAKDLNMSKRGIIKRWEFLTANNWIIETNSTYLINYNKVMNNVGEQSAPEIKEGEQSAPEIKKILPDIAKSAPIEVNKIHLLGEQNTPSEVNKVHLKGEQSIPIEEETKEKELKNNTKEEYLGEQNSPEIKNDNFNEITSIKFLTCYSQYFFKSITETILKEQYLIHLNDSNKNQKNPIDFKLFEDIIIYLCITEINDINDNPNTIFNINMITDRINDKSIFNNKLLQPLIEKNELLKDNISKINSFIKNIQLKEAC